MDRIKGELDVSNGRAPDKSRVTCHRYWMSERETRAVETLRLGFTAYCVRVMYLFFVSANLYCVLSKRLKSDLGANVVILRGNSDTDNSVMLSFGDWTLLTIVAMIRAGIAGMRVIDMGAGNGILSLVALKLPALTRREMLSFARPRSCLKLLDRYQKPHSARSVVLFSTFLNAERNVRFNSRALAPSISASTTNSSPAFLTEPFAGSCPNTAQILYGDAFDAHRFLRSEMEKGPQVSPRGPLGRNHYLPVSAKDT